MTTNDKDHTAQPSEADNLGRHLIARKGALACAHAEAIGRLAADGWEMPHGYTFDREAANACGADEADPAGLHTARELCVSEETKAALLAAAGGGISAETAAARLSVSGEALVALREAGRVLGVPRPDGSWVYPAGQFTSGGVVPLLPDLLRVRMSAWSALSWLVAASDVLLGRNPLSVLREGETAGLATVGQMIQAMEVDAYG